MHTKQEMNAENLRQRKLTTIRQRVSGVQSGVMKSKHRDLYTCMTVPIYNRCSALRCYWTPPYCDVYPIEKNTIISSIILKTISFPTLLHDSLAQRICKSGVQTPLGLL